MKQISTFKLSAVAAALTATVVCSPAALATNGYFVHGYGTLSNGMGGVGVALPQDSIAAATNPAGMAWIGNRADFSMTLFSPRRDATLDARKLNGTAGPGGGGASATESSGATLFLIPDAGFAMDMSGLTMGFTIYANGGMNTRYNNNVFAEGFGPAVPGFWNAVGNPGSPPPFPNMGTLGVNLAQVIMAPSISTKLGDSNSVGASLLVGYQRFRAYGLGLFQGLSSAPNNVTNKGDDDAWGSGIRLGWTGKLTNYLSVGATASSKIYMQKFDQYKGLFAEKGKFDIPANYAVGLALTPDDQWTLGFDVERILYGDVKAIANEGPTADELLSGLAYSLSGGTQGGVSRPLGTDNGFGFGWKNQTVYKLGVAYKYDDQWTLRAGLNYGKSPIDSSQNLFNIIAPGVVEKHATLGFSYNPTKANTISVAYMHAFRADQSYVYNNQATAPIFGPQSYNTRIGMSQNSIEAAYAWKF